MAYYSGQASSYQELLNVLTSVCVVHGWQWSNPYLSMGNAAIKFTLSASNIGAQGCVKSGSDYINYAPTGVRCCPLDGTTVSTNYTYNLFVFDDPAEVYLIVKFNTNCYFYLCFGISENLSGTGLWFSASLPWNLSTSIVIGDTGGGTAVGNNRPTSAAPFWTTNYDNTSYIHHNIDGLDWGTTGSNILSLLGAANAVAMISGLLSRQPNSWNQEAILLPISVYIARLSSKRSLVTTFKNSRFLRIDNLEPEQIIQLGSEKWKVFPFYQKNSAARNGGSQVLHTGTFGWAIRYDGP